MEQARGVGKDLIKERAMQGVRPFALSKMKIHQKNTLGPFKNTAGNAQKLEIIHQTPGPRQENIGKKDQ